MTDLAMVQPASSDFWKADPVVFDNHCHDLSRLFIPDIINWIVLGHTTLLWLGGVFIIYSAPSSIICQTQYRRVGIFGRTYR